MSDEKTTRITAKFRGTVVNNVDPEQRGAFKRSCPMCKVVPTTWALPCVPIAGKQEGVYMVPQVGARCGSNSSRAIRNINLGRRF